MPKADRSLFINGWYAWERMSVNYPCRGPIFTVSQLGTATYFSIWVSLVISDSDEFSSSEKAEVLSSIFSGLQVSRNEFLESKFDTHLVHEDADGRMLDHRALADLRDGWLNWQERELRDFHDFHHWNYFEVMLDVEIYDERTGEPVESDEFDETEHFIETRESFLARRTEISATDYLEALSANARQFVFPDLSADFG